MEWFAQGKDDGLCGFYAALNAVSYLLAESGRPLSDKGRQKFFDTAVDCLIQDVKFKIGLSPLEILKGDSWNGGLGQQQIHTLCIALGKAYDLILQSESKGEKSGRATFVNIFEGTANLVRRFAMIVPERGGGHWVVVTPHRDKRRFILIDNDRPRSKLLSNDGKDYVAYEAITLRIKS